MTELVLFRRIFLGRDNQPPAEKQIIGLSIYEQF
jgi:hypothetical protein